MLWGLCAALLGAIDTGPMNGAFRWLPQLSGDWGVLGGVPRLVNGLKSGQPEYQFYFLRFMLGFFEGGFFPSVILYLSHWFRTEDRAKAVACFVAAIPLTSVIGYPLSDWILHHVEWFGWPGWRWILILEGVLPILMGVVTMFVLPNRPRDARWLTPQERDWLVGELDREQQKKRRLGMALGCISSARRAADDRLFLPKRNGLRFELVHADHHAIAIGPNAAERSPVAAGF